ncbi:MAG: methyltransferase [Micavibrio aeruginosavorus]|uniref:Methyltransferase n=1 Tax=Micavibrio aeruginosavorus TaxID=349221 RepID=A0A2W5N8G2_9BACT|nr:MAG: methyltransferase [Micavibrio aeruginosavorus]
MTPSLDTLIRPLENAALPLEGKTLFLGAEWHDFLSSFNSLDIWQPWYPLAAPLLAKGYEPLDGPPPSNTYDLAMVQLPKQTDEAKFWLASALFGLKQGAWILCCAPNDANGNRIEKWLEEAGVQEIHSLSKNKCRAVWGRRPPKLPDIVQYWGVHGGKQNVQNGDGLQFVSQPGLFGWDKIDVGSYLLSTYIPKDLAGVGADFGCGYGYLAAEILQKCDGLKHLYLADADNRALSCAQKNIENVRGDKTITMVWCDLVYPAPVPPLDFIVMNPPFHTGKETQASLGQAFITTAERHLKKGGKLYMVANAHLPYEAHLKEKFSRTEQIAQEEGFKIILAVK